MPVSTINDLRRQAIERLDKLRLTPLRTKINDYDYNNKVNKYFTFSSKDNNDKLISVSVNNKKQFDKLNLNKLDRVYIGFDEDLENSILKVKEKTRKFI